MKLGEKKNENENINSTKTVKQFPEDTITNN